MRSITSAILTASLVSFLGCGAAEPAPVLPPVEPADAEAPLVELQATAWQAITGAAELPVVASDNVAVAMVELFRAGQAEALATATADPFTLTWDVSALPGGPAEIWARATDTSGNTAETAHVSVVVVGTGSPATLIDGSSFTMRIPANFNGVGEVDGKNHWTMPAGIHTVMAVIEWRIPSGQPIWNLELTIGKGECPDNGFVIGSAQEGTVGPLAVEVTQSAGFTTGLHFVHVHPVDVMDHKGQALRYTVRVYLFP